MLTNEYLAGLFDGEGCINLTYSGQSKSMCLRVFITNTDLNLIDILKAQFTESSIGQLKYPKNPDWKDGYQFKLANIHALKFLEQIYPFLIIKKKQAELAFSFWNYSHIFRHNRYHPRSQEYLDTLIEFKNKMHELNKKGKK